MKIMCCPSLTPGFIAWLCRELPRVLSCRAVVCKSVLISQHPRRAELIKDPFTHCVMGFYKEQLYKKLCQRARISLYGSIEVTNSALFLYVAHIMDNIMPNKAKEKFKTYGKSWPQLARKVGRRCFASLPNCVTERSHGIDRRLIPSY